MATQYFEHKLELGNFAEQPHFQLMEWHPSLNILAIASISSGTNIFFYGEDVSWKRDFFMRDDMTFSCHSRVNMMKQVVYSILAMLIPWLGIQLNEHLPSVFPVSIR